MDNEFMNAPKSSDLLRNHILNQIKNGTLQPGQRLPSVVDLAVQYGVGRSTVREACSALKATGWLEIRQGGGTFVSKSLPAEKSSMDQLIDHAADLNEILEVRKFIESGCASLASQRRNLKDLRAMEETLRLMSECMDDEEKSERLDLMFHMQIAHASHNALLLKMMDTLHQQLQSNMKDMRRIWFYGEASEVSQLYQEHLHIYEAIRDQDEAIAVNRMMIHLSKVEKVLKKLL